MAEKLSLVIPCYNEEKTLRSIVEQVLLLRNRSVDLELVIVDDCSRDNSLEVARQLGNEYPGIKVVHHEKNRGKVLPCVPVFWRPQEIMWEFRMQIWNMTLRTTLPCSG